MDERKLLKYEILLPLLASGLLFFVEKEGLNILAYAVPVLLLALYFFPVKMFLIRVISEDGVKNRYWYLLSNFIFSLILVNSVMHLLYEELEYVRYCLLGLGLVNLGMAVFFYFSDKSRRYMILHLLFIFLASGY